MCGKISEPWFHLVPILLGPGVKVLRCWLLCCCTLADAIFFIFSGSISTAGKPSSVVVANPSIPLKLLNLLSADQGGTIIARAEMFGSVVFVHPCSEFCPFFAFLLRRCCSSRNLCPTRFSSGYTILVYTVWCCNPSGGGYGRHYESYGS